MEEKILLNIEFNQDDIKKSIDKISEGRKAIDELIEANKKLSEQGKKNSVEYVKNQENIKALNTEVNTNSRIVQANTQAIKANENSIDALKAANKQLLIDRNKISTATQEGRDQITKLNAEYDKNAKVIAENSTAVEKQRFNIGNYQSALSGVSPELGKFAGNLSTATTASGGLSSGIMGMVKSSLTFIATPIGAIIAALVVGFKLLSTFITGSTAGMDLFEDASAAVSTVMEIVTDRVVKFVGGIGKLLTGDFKGGLNDIENSFSDIGDEIEREVALTLELNKAMRLLEDSEINYDIAVSKTTNKIKELLLQAKNRTLSEKERSKLLAEADKLEADRVKQLIANKQESLRITNEEANKRVQIARIAGETEDEFAQRLLDTGLLLDDQRDKVKDTVIAFNNALADGITIREKIQNQQDALAEKAEADRDKRAEAELKRLENEKKVRDEIAARNLKAQEELEVLRLEAQAKDLSDAQAKADKLIEIEKLKSEQLLANDKLTEDERTLIKAQSEEVIKGIQDEAAANRQAQIQSEMDSELEAFKDYTQELINEKKLELLEGKISQEEYNKEISDLQLAALETEQLIKQAYGEKDIALQGKITDFKIASKQKEVEMVKLSEQQKVDAVRNGISTMASAFNKQSVAFKVLASAETLIQTYKSATAAYAGMVQNVPAPYGIVLGIAAAAASIASGLANVAKINNTQLPKMEEGGIIPISGKRHSQGGEKVTIGGRAVAEVEDGENMVILKRGSSSLLKNLANINMLSGGTDFYNDRAPRRYLADGGIVARSAQSQLPNVRTMNIEDAISKMKIGVSVHDIDRVQGQVKIASVTSELS